MESLAICVPSKGRSELFSRKTLKILEHTKVPWFVFVEPDEYESYALLAPNNTLALDDNNQGMGYALNAIREFCLKQGYRYVWKMDDDVNHWYDSNRVKPKISQGEMLDSVANLLLRADTALRNNLGGISFPSNYFHDDWRNFTHLNKMFETTYIVKVSEWETPLQMKGYHEEFIGSASLVKKGLVTLRCGKFCWSADLSKAAGGLQSFDRVKEQELYFNVLESEYPELMDLTERQEYTQKTGKVFTVTNKSFFNKTCSKRLPLTSSTNLSKEIVECLNQLTSQS